MWTLLSDPQVQQALGQRLQALRLDRNLSQAALAQHAGVSLPTVQRLEGRGQATVATLIRVLRSLRRLDDLDALLAPPPVSPMALAMAAPAPRKRARRPRSATR